LPTDWAGFRDRGPSRAGAQNCQDALDKQAAVNAGSVGIEFCSAIGNPDGDKVPGDPHGI